MRILIVNTSDTGGGAAIAARRLFGSLDKAGIDTRMLVLHKTSAEDKVLSAGGRWRKKAAFVWERAVIWANNLFSRKNLFAVSIANTGFDITRTEAFRQSDLIHLHWINQGMLSLHDIQLILHSGKPVVWTMHDMWECTAICHYAYTCGRFKDECGNCPFLRFPGDNDLSHKIFKRKQRILQGTAPHIVTVSHWLAGLARQSTLLKDKDISVIPNTLSLSQFKREDKAECRKRLSWPADKHIILFGAARIDNPIKGFPILLQSLRHLLRKGAYRADELCLVLFGHIKFPREVLPLIPVPYIYLGWIADPATQSRLYSAADITVSASHYETFGQTLIEAQSCGCPPVSFGNSGQADIIRHKENGYLADYLSAESLADGIEWGLTAGQDETLKRNMMASVREKYAEEVIARQYIRLYQSLIHS